MRGAHQISERTEGSSPSCQVPIPRGGAAPLIETYDKIDVMSGDGPRAASSVAIHRGWSAQLLVAGKHELQAQGQSNLVVLQMIEPRSELWTDLLGTRRSFSLQAGTIVVVPAGLPSWWRHDHDGGLHIHMSFAPDVVATWADETCDPILTEPSIRPPSPQLDHLLRLLSQEIKQPGQSHALYCHSLSLAIGIGLRRSSVSGPGNCGKGGLSGRNLRLVKEYMSEHLADEVELPQLAAVAGLSPHHFCRAFKQSTGLPPHAWLTICRIEQAQRMMLDSPEMGLTEIALSVGYSSQAALGTAFKRSTGQTLGEWKHARII